MSFERRLLRLLPALLLLLSLGFVQSQQVLAAAGVESLGLFQLTGAPALCPTGSGSPTADAWQNAIRASAASQGIQVAGLPPACSNSAVVTKPIATSFVQDGSKRGPFTTPLGVMPLDQSYLTGGNTKDICDYSVPSPFAVCSSGWSWSTTSDIQDKDDIQNAGAAAYINPANGHEILYFMADRSDNAGDSNVGFWFNQAGVSTVAGGNFSGHHTVGDILILSNFGNGGSQPLIQTFKWTTSGPVATSSPGSSCGTSGASSTECAVVNTGTTPSVWPYESKGGTTNYGANEFYEGGIDLTALNGGTTPCLSSYLAETRSSGSITATLKDFATGSFTTCNAVIKLSPPTATNEINHSETYTATVLAGPAGSLSPQNGAPVTGAVTNGNGSTATITGGTCTTGVTGPTSANPSQAAGTCTIIISSATTGKVTLNASTSFTLSGENLSATTSDPANITRGGTGPSTKYYVDGKVTISTSSVNEVGVPHTFTVSVLQDTGDGTGFHAAGAGIPVSTSIVGDTTGGPAAMSSANSPTCGAGSGLTGSGSTNASGQCTVTVVSAKAGQILVSASATFSVTAANGQASQPFTRSVTGSVASGNGVKTYVDAGVTINPPKATNAVNNSETFTVTAYQNLGDGKGFVIAPGAGVTAGITNANGATATITGGTCAPFTPSGTTNASGQCTVIINSPTAGQVTVNATATLTVSGVSLSRTTNGAGNMPNSGPALKTYVDANISINPQSATNSVGQPHVLTVTILQNLGDGHGFVAAGAGIPVTTTMLADTTGHGTFTQDPGTNAFGTCGTPVLPGTTPPSASGSTGSGGTCTVAIVSTSIGDITVQASTTFALTVNGFSATLTRTTGTPANTASGGSNNAVKHYVAGTIQVTKHVEVGPFTAAPTVCYTLSHDPSVTNQVMNNPIAADTSAAGANPSYTLNADPTKAITECYNFPANTSGADTTESFTFSYHVLSSGTYMLHETVGAPYTANPDITGIVLVVTDPTLQNVTVPDQTNPLPPGSLKIIKTVNKGNVAPGTGPFTFTINSCAAGSSGQTCNSPTAITTTATISCPSSAPAAGCDTTVAVFTQTGLTEGLYQVVETAVPSGYTIDPSTNGLVVKVYASDTPSQASITVNNIRLLRMIVFTCDMQGHLVGSTVNVTSGNLPAGNTNPQSPTLTTVPAGVTSAATLCNLQPANYTNLLPATKYSADVTTP